VLLLIRTYGALGRFYDGRNYSSVRLVDGFSSYLLVLW